MKPHRTIVLAKHNNRKPSKKRKVKKVIATRNGDECGNDHKNYKCLIKISLPSP